MLSLSSLFFGRKASAASAAPVDASEIPKSFTMGSGSQIYNILMEQPADADFVDINYRKLSYAEAASLLKHKQQTLRVSRPAAARVARNQYEVLAADKHDDADDELAASLPEERFKKNNYFSKNKVFKAADKKKGMKSLRKAAAAGL